MLKIGLTGGIASGKTVVREHWASQGVATVDADALVHELFAPPSELRHRIAEEFAASRSELVARRLAQRANATGAIGREAAELSQCHRPKAELS